ncbi:MAG: hypothetical protein EGR20_02140 [Alistipes onderdonkii]|nr:hypothetical protein [Alistipes onderdonkii]
MGRFCALALLLCAAWAPSEAKIKLPAIVGDNMVLQQSCEVKLWGWARSRRAASPSCITIPRRWRRTAPPTA